MYLFASALSFTIAAFIFGFFFIQCKDQPITINTRLATGFLSASGAIITMVVAWWLYQIFLQVWSY